MAEITLKGNPIKTIGELPSGSAPDFTLVASDLSEVNLGTYAGKRKILNIFPSVDTGTCATSVRTFNEKAASLDNTVVLCISKDLPFALNRFCGAEGIENCVTLSDFRGSFASDYGVEIVDPPLKGLASRSIVVLDENNNILHTQQVGETVDEPDYAAAIAVL